MATSPVLEASALFKQELARNGDVAIQRLVFQYRRSFRSLARSLDDLLLEIGETPPTLGQLTKMERYQSLIAGVLNELLTLQGSTYVQMQKAAELGIDLGMQHGLELMSLSISKDIELAGAFNTLPSAAVKEVIGFLSPGSPLYQRHSLLAPATTDTVVNGIVEGIVRGYNPKKIARQFQTHFGQGLTDSMRFVRTAQLWSYREANRATYLVNSEVVEGWYWHAELSKGTCASCIAMHGTWHPLEEPLNDHHNGRCAPIPAVKGFDAPFDMSGEEWFDQQPVTVQKEILGPSKLEALRQKKFSFDQLPGERTDGVYGPMRVEKTLQELIDQQGGQSNNG